MTDKKTADIVIPISELTPLLTVGQNQESIRANASAFCARVRERFAELAGIKNSGVEAGDWFQPFHIQAIADRWCIPMLFFNTGAHWVLGLENPINYDEKWQARVWDPKKGDRYINLRDYAHSDPNAVMQGGNFSSAAYEWESYGPAKRFLDPLQDPDDSSNCGPLILYQAIVQNAQKQDPQFSSGSLEKIEKDLQIRFDTV